MKKSDEVRKKIYLSLNKKDSHDEEKVRLRRKVFIRISYGFKMKQHEIFFFGEFRLIS